MAWGTLAAPGISAGAPSLTVNSGAGASYPPTGNFLLRIDSEFLTCTARTGDTMTVLRGQYGTMAAAHSGPPSAALVLGTDLSGAVINAIEAGVPADGSSDATAAIQGLITALSAAGGGRIVFPAGVYKLTSTGGLIAADNVELHLMRGAWLQKAFTAPSGFTNAVINNPLTMPGGVIKLVSNFAITGEGKLGCADLTHGGDIVALWGNDLRVTGITVDTYSGGQAFLLAGDRIRMSGATVTNAQIANGAGGIRMCGGRDFTAIGCHIESGDDALQFVPFPAAGRYRRSGRRELA